ncbi:MAG: M1 family metallopeptidase [Flavobacteriales bacterium]|nr:M1 family metallopeptidase [Flavobacteriales bacterium]MDW8410199.1 M1 family aminopeptidase [Flavobacteriales bacterium]
MNLRQLGTFGFLLLVGTFSSIPAEAQRLLCEHNDPARAPREHHADFELLEGTFRFQPHKGLIQGEVTHHFRWIRSGFDTLFLDAPNIKIISVQRAKINLDFYTIESGVIIKFPEKSIAGQSESLTIKYEATPRKGLYFIGWTDSTGLSRRQIWSQGQGIDNRHWIPMYDEMNDKIKTRLKFYFDSTYQVLSNGRLVKKEAQPDGTLLWEYVMEKPHAPYLIMVGIGKYHITQQKSESGVPLYLYLYPDRMEDFSTTYTANKEIFDFLEKEIGYPYPWPSYSQIPVQEYIYGAMENTSATVFGDFFIVDRRAFHDRNYIAVNAHELAHQWFGDLVTARSARHIWLQESFATFYNWLYERVHFGQDHYDWNRRQAQISSLREGQKNSLPIAHSQAGTTRHYPKGAFVLHMLRHLTGPENFRRAIVRYLQENAYKNVTSEDLLRAFHDELGLGLEWFWDQWVYGGGEPVLEVEEKMEDTTWAIRIRQLQEGEGVVRPFRLPLDVELIYPDGTKEIRHVVVDSLICEFRWPISSKGRPLCVIVDAGNQILRDLRHLKTSEALAAQALHATHMLDRYDGLVGLREHSLPNKKQLLETIYHRETFWAVKGEALRQLLSGWGQESSIQALWLQALTSSDNNLRHEALKALELRRVEALEPHLTRLLKISDASYSLLETALRYLSRHNTKLAIKFAKGLEPLLSRPNAQSLRATYWEIMYALKPQNKDEAWKKLVELTRPGYEFRTRLSAFQSLARLKLFPPEAQRHALQALFSTNIRLSQGGASYLKEGLKAGLIQKFELEELARLSEDFPDKKQLLASLFNY